MRETSIMDNSNYKMQARVRVCEGNIDKNNLTTPIEIILWLKMRV